MLRRFISSLWLAFALTLAGRGQSPGTSSAPQPPVSSWEQGLPILQSWTAKDYRSHHEVVSAVQTKEGSVCFASMASVLEFDGVRWTKYPVPGAWVKQVALGGDGHVYVAADGEFGRLERTLDGSRAYRSFTDLVPTNQRPFGVVRTIAVRPEGVYFSSQTAVFRWSDAGLALWPIEGGKPTYLHSDGPDLWLSNAATGLQRFDGRSWPVVSNAQEFKSNPRATHARLKDGRHLFGLFQGGIVQWDGTRVSPWPTAIDEILRTARIMDLMPLPDGRLAVATGLNGLYLLDDAGRYLDRFDQSRGLNNDTVFDLALDRSGGLWMSTRNGVARWDPSLAITRFDKSLGLPEASVLGFVRHRDTLHVMLTGVGIYHLVRDTNRMAGGRFEALPADVGSAHRAVSHPSGLVIGSERGVFLWNGTLAIPVAKPQGNAKQTWVCKRDPRFVFVGTESAILVYAVDGLAWREVMQWPMPGEVLRLGEDTDGAIWAGISSTGYVRIPPPSDGSNWAASKPLTIDASRGLSGRDSFFQTEESPLGISLLSDYAGYRFDRATERAVIEDRFTIGGEKGLYFGIQSATRDGEMWGGVTRVGSQDIYTLPWPFGRFRVGTGGQPEWRSAPASWNALIGPQGPFATLAEGTSTNGTLWVAAESSLLRIVLGPTPAAVVPEFRMELTGPRVGSNTLPLEGMHSLAYTRDPIVFGFKAPRLDLGADVRYQSRLVGFNEAWSAPTEVSEARFSGLSGGPYTFEVRAIDADGRLSDTNRCVFEVAAPPYRSGRALAGYALLVLMGFQGFVKWRVERVDRKRRELESLVAVRTRELAEARDAAEEASRAKSRFLANMSHELRTPLNGVLGFSQLLSQEQELSNRNRDRIRLIQSCGDHLLGLINDVLDLSKVEAGRVELRLAPMDLRELLRDLDATFAPRAAQRGLRLHVATNWSSPPRVLGDAQRLRQVLENLLGNALKFTREGSVRLEAIDAGEGRCQFVVSDTGAGMSPEDCARLFQPFSQAVSGRPAEPGAGLGLAISQHLVGLMGGRIEVESEPGKGSRFQFTIPFLPAGEVPVAAATMTGLGPRQYLGPRRRVLVVDDVEVNRRLLREMLGSLGFVVDDVATGEAALDRLAIPEVRPELVILDLRMPGMDGFELTRRLRALPEGVGLKIIATSASVFSFTRDEAVKLGCDDFLPKPFQQQELEQMLEQCLGLEWVPTPVVKTAEPVVATGAEMAVSDLEQLLEAANRGDVGAMRMQLSTLRESGVGPVSVLNELDALASQFQMAALRERLGALIRARC